MKEPLLRTSCSVVVPTLNRPASLERCLAGLAAQDYPRDLWDVIVVDDGGDVSLDGVVGAARERLSVRLLRTEPGGPALARNHGVRNATGHLIAFTDDDCSPDPGWLTALVRSHAAHPDAMIGGHTYNVLHHNPYATSSQVLIDYLYAYYNASSDDSRLFTSNNMAVGREQFLESGGFDPLFRSAAGEDRELCARWRHLGWPLVYAPEARVAHAHSLTLRGFVRQHLRYGRAAYYFRIRESHRASGGVRLEPPRFYVGLLRFPFGRMGVVAGMQSSALLVVSQAANAAGYFTEKLAKGTGGAAALPPDPLEAAERTWSKSRPRHARTMRN
jgi:GT2 family glycosyltransferase